MGFRVTRRAGRSDVVTDDLIKPFLINRQTQNEAMRSTIQNAARVPTR